MTQTIEVAAVQVSDNPSIPELPVSLVNTSGTLAKFDPIKAQLLLLQKKVATTVFDITTTAGMKTACELRRECVDTRVSASKTYETLNAPLLTAQRGMREIVKEIEGVVSPLEAKLDAQIKAQEAIKEAERRRKAAEEEARVKAITEKIQAIATLPAQAARQDAKGITALDRGLAELVIDEAAFGEFAGDVTELVAHIRRELGEMFVLAADREAEAERVRLEGLRQEEERKRRTLLDAQRRSIDSLRSFPLKGLGKDSNGLRLMLSVLDTGTPHPYDPELQEVALEVEREARGQIEAMLAERLATEQLAADQQRREQEAAAQRQRDQEAAEKRQREADAAHAKLAQELKQQQDAFEAEKAEARRLKAEDDAKRLAERQAAEARAKELEPKPEPVAAKVAEPVPVPAEPLNWDAPAPAVVIKSATPAGARPSDLGIATAVSVRFGVSQAVACEWLRNFKADTVLAAIAAAPVAAPTFSEIPV